MAGPPAIWRPRAGGLTHCVVAFAAGAYNVLCYDGSAFTPQGPPIPTSEAPAALWVEGGAADGEGHLYAAYPAAKKVTRYDLADGAGAPVDITDVGTPVNLMGSSAGIGGPLKTVYILDAAGRRVIAVDDTDLKSRSAAKLPSGQLKLAKLDGIKVDSNSTTVTITLHLSSALDEQALVRGGSNIAAGSASFQLWQAGISASARSKSSAGATVTISQGGGAVLVVKVSAKKDAFTRFDVRRSGSNVVVTLTKKPASSSNPGGGGGGGGGGTTIITGGGGGGGGGGTVIGGGG